jgi:hypothetical protein
VEEIKTLVFQNARGGKVHGEKIERMKKKKEGKKEELSMTTVSPWRVPATCVRLLFLYEAN